MFSKAFINWMNIQYFRHCSKLLYFSILNQNFLVKILKSDFCAYACRNNSILDVVYLQCARYIPHIFNIAIFHLTHSITVLNQISLLLAQRQYLTNSKLFSKSSLGSSCWYLNICAALNDSFHFWHILFKKHVFVSEM